jgi:hypothetical protein
MQPSSLTEQDMRRLAHQAADEITEALPTLPPRLHMAILVLLVQVVNSFNSEADVELRECTRNACIDVLASFPDLVQEVPR